MDRVTSAVESVAEKVREVVDEVAGGAAERVLGKDRPLPLPETREQLLALHQVARAKRDAAPLDSHQRAEAAFELERIEIQIARIERAMDPPLV